MVQKQMNIESVQQVGPVGNAGGGPAGNGGVGAAIYDKTPMLIRIGGAGVPCLVIWGLLLLKVVPSSTPMLLVYVSTVLIATVLTAGVYLTYRYDKSVVDPQPLSLRLRLLISWYYLGCISSPCLMFMAVFVPTKYYLAPLSLLGFMTVMGLLISVKPVS